MPRSNPEWIGKTDDTPIPRRVHLRIYDKHNGLCATCGLPAHRPQTDHIVRLKDGGENREDNLQLLCFPCHKFKSGQEQREGAVTDRIKAKALGYHKPKGRPMPGTKRSGIRKRMDGTVEWR